MAQGRFIVFEGGDGAGKSTQVDLLAAALHARGHSVLVTREPGGTNLGENLRAALLHGGAIDERAEALLYAADRAQHTETVVRPAIGAGDTVISDRYMDSSIAYQGGGRGLGIDQIRDLSLWAVRGLLPDLTVLLDAPAETTGERIVGEPDRMERAGDEFHRVTNQTFRVLAASDPGRYLVLDARLPVEEIHSLVLAAVTELFGQPHE
ncbi:MAG: dTMP kinase [Varibaculum sp.]|nr:dTMP kinase [Varibaculum sp.]